VQEVTDSHALPRTRQASVALTCQRQHESLDAVEDSARESCETPQLAAADGEGRVVSRPLGLPCIVTRVMLHAI